MNNQRRAEEKFSAERSRIMLSGPRMPMNRYRANTHKEVAGHTTGHQ